MKKSTLIIATLAFIAFVILATFSSCSDGKKITGTITGIENLSDGDCIYTVNSDTDYVFIDSCGKYKIGYQISE